MAIALDCVLTGSSSLLVVLITMLMSMQNHWDIALSTSPNGTHCYGVWSCDRLFTQWSETAVCVTMDARDPWTLGAAMQGWTLVACSLALLCMAIRIVAAHVPQARRARARTAFYEHGVARTHRCIALLRIAITVVEKLSMLSACAVAMAACWLNRDAMPWELDALIKTTVVIVTIAQLCDCARVACETKNQTCPKTEPL